MPSEANEFLLLINKRRTKNEKIETRNRLHDLFGKIKFPYKLLPIVSELRGERAIANARARALECIPAH